MSKTERPLTRINRIYPIELDKVWVVYLKERADMPDSTWPYQHAVIGAKKALTGEIL